MGYFNVSYKLLFISLCLLVILYCKGNIKASCIKCAIYAKSILTLNLDDDKDSNVLLFCFKFPDVFVMYTVLQLPSE